MAWATPAMLQSGEMVMSAAKMNIYIACNFAELRKECEAANAAIKKLQEPRTVTVVYPQVNMLPVAATLVVAGLVVAGNDRKVSRRSILGLGWFRRR